MKVFDSSALLAVLFDEPGGVRVTKLMAEGDAVVSAVNLAEVVARLLERGTSAAEADAAIDALELDVRPLTAAQAVTSGHLRPATRSLGLSLGDRCCLALAKHLPAATIVTADRPWKALKGFRFEFIR
jgi:ribonuclease VapC